jgi:hypothetical protein
LILGSFLRHPQALYLEALYLEALYLEALYLEALYPGTDTVQ